MANENDGQRNPAFSYAPWTDQEVTSLNDFQDSGVWHPFTGPDHEGKGRIQLIATQNGWVEKEGGEIVQNWAHIWMTNDAWRERYKALNGGRKYPN